MKKIPFVYFVSAAAFLTFSWINKSLTVLSLINLLLFLGYARQTKFLPFLALIPLFHFQHINFDSYLFEVLILLIINLLTKTKKKILIAPLLLVTLLSLISANHFQKEKLIWFQNPFQEEIIRQQKEALYLPYPLRPIIFNQATTYTYLFLTNIAKFLSLENFYRQILLVNIPFLIIGIFKMKQLKKLLPIASGIIMLSTFTFIGLQKSVDSLQPIIVARGILLTLIINGLESKPKLKPIYLILLLPSLLLQLGLNIR